MATGRRDLDVLRTVARAGIDPPAGWARFDPRFDRLRADVLRVLRANLPEVRTGELVFRTRCAAGLLNWLVLAPVGGEIRNKSEKQVERLLAPMLARTFRGTHSAWPARSRRRGPRRRWRGLAGGSSPAMARSRPRVLAGGGAVPPARSRRLYGVVLPGGGPAGAVRRLCCAPAGVGDRTLPAGAQTIQSIA